MFQKVWFVFFFVVLLYSMNIFASDASTAKSAKELREAAIKSFETSISHISSKDVIVAKPTATISEHNNLNTRISIVKPIENPTVIKTKPAKPELKEMLLKITFLGAISESDFIFRAIDEDGDRKTYRAINLNSSIRDLLTMLVFISRGGDLILNLWTKAEVLPTSDEDLRLKELAVAWQYKDKSLPPISDVTQILTNDIDEENNESLKPERMQIKKILGVVASEAGMKMAAEVEKIDDNGNTVEKLVLLHISSNLTMAANIGLFLNNLVKFDVQVVGATIVKYVIK